MILNYKLWETVENGNFIVNKPFFDQGVQYNIGDPFPKEGQPSMWALYETHMITDVEPEPKKAKKKQKEQ